MNPAREADMIVEAANAEAEAQRELERELELEIERQIKLDEIERQLTAHRASGQWM